MTRIPLKKRYATLVQGLQTVTGLRRMGIFTPLKFAGRVPEAPPVYAAWKAAFEAAEPDFEDTLDAIADLKGAFAEALEARPGGGWSGFFGAVDSAAAFAVLRRWPPRRIIEVGSGASTHVMAAAAPEAQLLCIDPVPRHDITGLRLEWVEGVLEPVHQALFQALEAGDVAFFDSSHVLHQGTDVDIIVNRILPVLKPGVLVHVHDIFLPDPYPSAWRLRAYNEQYGLAGWVLSGAMEPLFASHYAATRMTERLREALDGLPGATLHGGSLWLRRV